MPQDLIDKFVTASQYGAAYACIRQLSFGYLDMAFHTIENPLRASQDVAAFEKFLLEVEALSLKNNVNVVITSSVPTEETTDVMRKFI